MNYPSPQALAERFHFNARLIHMQARGLTHAESLLQLPFRGNCLNWVVGHILTSRDACLRLLELPATLSAGQLAVYDRGAEPLTQAEQAAPLEELLAKLDEADRLLRAALEPLDEAELARAVDFGRQPQPLGEVLAFLQWHETYHLGQLELLRQLAGKDDKVV